jgi:hypothetical protein
MLNIALVASSGGLINNQSGKVARFLRQRLVSWDTPMMRRAT